MNPDEFHTTTISMDALIDCMCDLSWLDEDKLLVRVKNHQKFAPRQANFSYEEMFGFIQNHWKEKREKENGSILFVIKYI